MYKRQIEEPAKPQSLQKGWYFEFKGSGQQLGVNVAPKLQGEQLVWALKENTTNTTGPVTSCKIKDQFTKSHIIVMNPFTGLSTNRTHFLNDKQEPLLHKDQVVDGIATKNMSAFDILSKGKNEVISGGYSNGFEIIQKVPAQKLEGRQSHISL